MGLQVYVCRNCGSDRIVTSEDLSGTCGIDEIYTDENGDLQYSTCGYTDIDWDSATTDGYLCLECYEKTPDLASLVVPEHEYLPDSERASLLGNIA